MKTFHSFLAFALAAIVCGAVTVSCEPTTLSYEWRLWYSVNVTTDGNGTVTVTPESAEPGETVTLTATPDEGYAFTGWTVTAGNVTLDNTEANPATFTMPDGKVAVSAKFDTERSTTESALWHEGVEAWIVPQPDPYALDNVQAAAINLAALGTTRAETLTATHYALKIFPRTEDEQWALERKEGVMLSYIPFDWLALTEEEARVLEEQAQATKADGDRPLYPNDSPYTVTHNDAVNIEGVEEAVSQKMPVVYAVWPVDKELPEELEYEVEYEVWLPSGTQTRGAAMNGETMRALEDEAIRLALGEAAVSGRAATRAEGVTLSGEFWVWEALRTVQGAVPNVKVKFHLGSKIVETVADSEGNFSVSADEIPAASSWDIVFQTAEWKLTRNGSTIPKFFVQGDVYRENYWSESKTHIRTSIQPYDAALVKALSYYFYTDHNLSRWVVPDGIRVIAHNSSSSSYNGLFTYTGSNSCYITIYRNNTSNVNMLMGTIFHELGHFVHFKERGGYSGMKIVDRLVAESFASYAGWYLTEKYYRELGYEKDHPSRDISGQARQTSWRSTTSGDWGYYSPLFVDLVDDYNQSDYGDIYNYDEVKGTHYSTIMRIVKESTDWASCKSILYENADLVKQDLDTFLAPYEYWYSSR